MSYGGGQGYNNQPYGQQQPYNGGGYNNQPFGQQQQQPYTHNAGPQFVGGQQQQPFGSYGGGQQPYGGGGPVLGYGGRKIWNRNTGPPPNADMNYWNWFTAVDTDGSGEVSPLELQKALVNGDWSSFSLDTVKLLMSMFDKDRSGTIVYDEFAQLFNYVGDWSRCFKYFDRDNSGSIDAGEFDNALRQFGYPINPQLIQLLERKYDLKNVHPQHSGWIGAAPGFRPNGITFDKFVTSCVVIKQMTDTFRRLDLQNSGHVTMSYDNFLHTVLSLP